MKTILWTVLISCSYPLLAQKSDVKGILGDYDGNGTKEYAYTKVNDCSDECDGECITTIYFSDEKIRSFTISPARNGTLYNIKDLNGDGKDEIGFYPDWCTSCWHPFYVYSLKKTGWNLLLEPISTHCSQWEDEKFPIRKDPKKKGYLIVTSSQWKDDDIKIISQRIKIN